MILQQFILGELENNNYLLIDEASKEAVLVDCTKPSLEIEQALNEYGATLKYILLTHGHFDHIMGVNYFKAKFNPTVLVNQDDKILIDSVKEFTRSFGLPEGEVQKIDGFFAQNQEIKFGEKTIRVINTPGHTLGGVCFLVDDNIFTGDTLFRESVGRTDLPGGNFSQLKDSIENKLFVLDENIKIFPGHGSTSTIGWEKQNNKFL